MSSLLPAAYADFIQQGLSISVASRDIRHVPSLSRALGCIVEASQINLYLLRPQSLTLLRDIEKCHAVAAVFSRPTTHQTIQIKGQDATVWPAPAEHAVIIERQVEAFLQLLNSLGYDMAFLQTFARYSWDDVVQLRFTAAEVFEQTPGPKAGARLESKA